jgi:hypothetical protein
MAMAGLLDQVIGLMDDPKKRAALDAMLGAIPQKQRNVSRGIRQGIADSVAFPREYMNTYQPGSMASDNPGAVDWAAGTAMNMVGAPALTGGVPAGALGSAAKSPKDLLTLYRGESAYNKGGNFYTPDAEWARQFTQSGRQKEILQRQMPSGAVYDPPQPIYAGNPDAVDAAIAEARQRGFSAVRLSEGPGEPPSVFVFDKSKLKRGPESGSTFGAIAAMLGLPALANAPQLEQAQ